MTTLVTEKDVQTAIENYGNIKVQLLACAVAFNIGIESIGAVRDASVAATRTEMSLLKTEVRELKGMLEERTDCVAKLRKAEKKLLDASVTCDSCSPHSPANTSFVQSDTSFVAELSKKLGENYLTE